MVATFVVGETYSPRSAVRSDTNPSMGEKTIAYDKTTASEIQLAFRIGYVCARGHDRGVVLSRQRKR